MTGRRVLACAVRECRRLLRDPNLFLVVFVCSLAIMKLRAASEG